MTEPPASPHTDEGADIEPDGVTVAGMPRWVQVFGAIAVVVVLVAIIAMVIAGGDHGPGRHTSEGAAASTS